MRKSVKILIAKAEEVIERWPRIDSFLEGGPMDYTNMVQAMEDLEAAIKKVKGES